MYKLLTIIQTVGIVFWAYSLFNVAFNPETVNLIGYLLVLFGVFINSMAYLKWKKNQGNNI